MPTTRILLDSTLLKETDRAARRIKVSRSTLIREALRSRLRRLAIRELEERDRRTQRQRGIQPGKRSSLAAQVTTA